ncbi:uncharacterized protein LOC131317151 [Rhododendron vialii]|uniref:uncharacterized protein LOC131317151 n=1 Tax=Rhododendron vialii TaxID=182163 RepID=UPI00265ECD5A|nr:uncharacterized protein LOC131317151 [Rhododendron vialii]
MITIKSFCTKAFHHVSCSARASPAHNIHFLQIHPFSSSLKSLKNPANKDPFTVTYLRKSCGFSPEEAISASKRVNFESPERPDSVLAFFQNHEFTKTQISNLIKKFPRLLLSDPNKILLPKFEFLKSKGISAKDVARIVSTSPLALRSLENLIIPSFNFCRNYFQSEEKAVAAVKRCAMLLLLDELTHVTPNIAILREAGVPNDSIMRSLTNQPRPFMMRSNEFRQIVEDVQKIGFDPLKHSFFRAIHVLRAVSKSRWEKKVEVYKKWGWTADEIFVAFKLHPDCMGASEGKINRVMDFVVNQIGWEPSFIARRPVLISLSLEKRIIPRFAIYQVLSSKGIIKTKDIYWTTLQTSEKQFLEKFVICYGEEAPELLKLYKEKLVLAM